ncbi:hypothetical protein ACS0TY_024610 [Phlomoides rotata]
MDEGKEDTEVNSPHRPLPFLEVVCQSSGKIRRFSAGTEAGFAVNSINKKLLSDCGGGRIVLPATHIEAVKEGELEEPITFGPNSLLVDYGTGWKLQTVIDSNGDGGGVHIGTTRSKNPSSANGNGAPHSTTRPLSLIYVGKILLAFLMIFVLGAAFTLLLENLPRLILYINESEYEQEF